MAGATLASAGISARDLNIQHTLMQRFGHADCGVYAEVIAGGAIAEGDEVRSD